MDERGRELELIFRRESGKIVAYLTRHFGADHIDLAESVFQEALVKALETWPREGMPANPAAWLLTVAKNKATDMIRAQMRWDLSPVSLELLSGAESPEVVFENEIRDDELKLFFVCCHPILSREVQVALTLKTVCGFSVPEIAKAFLAKEETIAQRLVRAKRKIADAGLRFEVPEPGEIKARLETVLEVIYLLFNEGYSATLGESAIRRELCDEAIFRAEMLAAHPLCRSPKVHALSALMYFQSSRFDSRIGGDGELLVLEEQDRGQWDRAKIDRGLDHLDQAASGEEISAFHLQAGIASCHALAPTFEDTEWEQIVSLYDLLLIKSPSPVVALNRAVAVSHAEGPQAGLDEIAAIESDPALQNYYLLPAAKADLHRRLGDRAKAKSLYEIAMRLAGNEPEKRLLARRIEECGGLKLV